MLNAYRAHVAERAALGVGTVYAYVSDKTALLELISRDDLARTDISATALSALRSSAVREVVIAARPSRLLSGVCAERLAAYSCGGSHGSGPNWVIPTVFPRVVTATIPARYDPVHVPLTCLLPCSSIGGLTPSEVHSVRSCLLPVFPTWGKPCYPTLP